MMVLLLLMSISSHLENIKGQTIFSHLLTLDYYPEEVAALVTELDLER